VKLVFLKITLVLDAEYDVLFLYIVTTQTWWLTVSDSGSSKVSLSTFTLS